MVPFESLGAVSYSPSVVTMAVSIVVCEIHSIKEWRDLGNKVMVRSRSLQNPDDNETYNVPVSLTEL